MSLKQSLCISDSPKCHLSRVCVSQIPRNVPNAELCIGVPKMSLKAEFVYLGVPKCNLSIVCVSQSPRNVT